MKGRGLKTLIRLQRWQLDELRRRIAPLEQQRADLLDHGRSLLETLHSESLAVGNGHGNIEDLNTFRARVHTEQALIADKVEEIDKRIEQLRTQMAAAFQDAKKFEITEEQREQARQHELEQREQARLDEVALNGHRRRSAGGF
jgi:hypothetical protein